MPYYLTGIQTSPWQVLSIEIREPHRTAPIRGQKGRGGATRDAGRINDLRSGYTNPATHSGVPGQIAGDVRTYPLPSLLARALSGRLTASTVIRLSPRLSRNLSLSTQPYWIPTRLPVPLLVSVSHGPLSHEILPIRYFIGLEIIRASDGNGLLLDRLDGGMPPHRVSLPPLTICPTSRRYDPSLYISCRPVVLLEVYHLFSGPDKPKQRRRDKALPWGLEPRPHLHTLGDSRLRSLTHRMAGSAK